MTVKVLLTLLNGLDTPQHRGCEHKEAAGLVELDLSHDAEGRPQADGHHGRVLEDVVLLAQDQRGDGQREERRGGVDHLCKGQLDIVQAHVSKGDAGTEGQAQQEHLTLGAGGQVLLCHPPVADDPQLDQAVVHHYGCEHVQGGQQQRVPEVVNSEYPFVEAGDGGPSHQPDDDSRQQMEHLCGGPPSPSASVSQGRLAFGEAIGVDHVRIMVLSKRETHVELQPLISHRST